MSLLRQNIDSLVEGFYQIGVRQWIISPGSRNAPIVASIVKHGKFNLISQPDERAAAFIGLGANMANELTGIICTSGTAVLNYYPAVCEAFYAQTPLLVVSADRPKELIDQWDGQTIRQENIFEKHCKTSYSIDANLHEEAENEIASTINAINKDLKSHDFGPVHLNVPIAEPLYKNIDSAFEARSIQLNSIEPESHFDTIPNISADANILLFVGELNSKDSDDLALGQLGSAFPILTEKTSNCKVSLWDGWEQNFKKLNGLPKPDVLITLGKNYVNKDFKNFIRANKPKSHIHIQTSKYVGNPFDTDMQSYRLESINRLEEALKQHTNQDKFNDLWKIGLIKNENSNETLINKSTELEAINEVFNSSFDAIHIGNSTPIRLAGLLHQPKANVYCNRGTSGIDGCVSTAVGYAISKPLEKVACIVGDISFLYDSNAFWCEPKPKNLQLIVLNNGAGNIFNLIEGPNLLPEMTPYIQTPHKLTCEHYAKHYCLSYSTDKKRISSNIQLIEIFISGNESLWELLAQK